eukprot:6370564-Alexandrium_andersonii.AAC.1
MKRWPSRRNAGRRPLGGGRGRSGRVRDVRVADVSDVGAAPQPIRGDPRPARPAAPARSRPRRAGCAPGRAALHAQNAQTARGPPTLRRHRRTEGRAQENPDGGK